MLQCVFIISVSLTFTIYFLFFFSFSFSKVPDCLLPCGCSYVKTGRQQSVERIEKREKTHQSRKTALKNLSGWNCDFWGFALWTNHNQRQSSHLHRGFCSHRLTGALNHPVSQTNFINRLISFSFCLTHKFCSVSFHDHTVTKESFIPPITVKRFHFVLRLCCGWQ